MLYTRLEVEDGLFTGRVIEPICFEEGKIYWLQQFIEEHRIDLAKSWFYTDSITDLPLLEHRRPPGRDQSRPAALPHSGQAALAGSLLRTP